MQTFNPRVSLALRSLAADLEAYGEGQEPSPDELAVAPLVEDWRLGQRVATAVHGTTFDHPVLLGPRNIATSELYFLDPALRWARTFSRVYRLGSPRSYHFS
jgi:hypothetical protein